MLGEFYGPAAEEVGGVLNGESSRTATTPEQVLAGLFFGKERFVGGVYDSTEEFTPLTMRRRWNRNLAARTEA